MNYGTYLHRYQRLTYLNLSPTFHLPKNNVIVQYFIYGLKLLIALLLFILFLSINIIL